MAFFKCPKCKKIWQYPIEKCPQCFLNLERMKSEKIKVIGVSKVQIPTIFHPKTPYFVLLLEDYNPPSSLPPKGRAPENRNRWVQKSIKEYKIGDIIEYETSRDKNAVAIWRIKYDILEAMEKVVEFIGGLEINQDSKILILPTLISLKHSYLAENTSPEFLDAILKFLFKIGIKSENVKVASQSFDEIEIGVKAQKSGLLEVCQKNKVMPFDLTKGNFIKKDDLEISEEVFKSDLILNLPILKMGKAQATENIFFLLKKENFLAQKYLYPPSESEGGKEGGPSLIEKEIFEKLEKEIPQFLTVAEGNYVQDEKGFTHYLNLVFASFNSKNLDSVFFEITKRKLPEILEDVKIEELKVLGREIDEVASYG